MVRLVCSVAGVLGLALSSAGIPQQYPDGRSGPFADVAAQVTRDLASTDPRTAAWGAYAAGAYHVISATVPLQRLLESPPALEGRERRAFLDVVLDALIQLNARPQAALLAAHAQSHPTHTLVLLANATERQPVLLERLPKSAGLSWYAVANMLLQDRAPGFAAHLLDPLRLQLTVSVSESGQVAGIEGTVSAGVGDGFDESPRGFPPHAEYRLESAARPGFVVLVDGPRPVYYSRTVEASFQYSTSQLLEAGPTDADRVSYLHALLAAADVPLPADTLAFAKWTSSAALIRDIEDQRALVQRQYQNVVAALVGKGLLAKGGTWTPRIDTRLVDHRTDRTTPLPSVR